MQKPVRREENVSLKVSTFLRSDGPKWVQYVLSTFSILSTYSILRHWVRFIFWVQASTIKMTLTFWPISEIGRDEGHFGGTLTFKMPNIFRLQRAILQVNWSSNSQNFRVRRAILSISVRCAQNLFGPRENPKSSILLHFREKCNIVKKFLPAALIIKRVNLLINFHDFKKERDESHFGGL